ncbi:hypothetical protein ACFSQJ_11455 [Croceitalea marina]|uniref:Uncharacterized protein n=1 Tax=Croceitalea marina TaxID=1775166 RepID=A0ABW5MYN0_9FLAO
MNLTYLCYGSTNVLYCPWGIKGFGQAPNYSVEIRNRNKQIIKAKEKNYIVLRAK